MIKLKKLIILLFFIITSFNIKGVELYSAIYTNNYNLPKINITDKEKKWLKNRTLKVGFIIKDFPPYDISNDGQASYYEGITADYLKIIEYLLNIPIQLTPYKTRQDAILAIKRNEVDILTSSNIYETSLGLELSIPYQSDIPALFISNKPIHDKKELKTIGMLYEYLPNEVIEKSYPNAKLITYDTPQKTLSAVLYGQVDAIILDLYSANYQINSEFIDKLRFKELLDFNSKGFAFAIAPENIVLLKLINKALGAINKNVSSLLTTHWNGGGTSVPNKNRLLLARQMTKNYLGDKKNIRVVLSKYSAPVSYVGEDGNPQGIFIEFLDMIKIYTGLRFEYIFTNSIEEQVNILESGRADISALTATINRNDRFNFSKNLLNSSYVIISKKNSNPNKKLNIYIPRRHVLSRDIKLANPSANIIFVDSYLDALNEVEKSDDNSVTLTPLLSANYYIEKYFKGKLYIKGIATDIPPATLSIAATKDNNDIINLFSQLIDFIPANDIKLISNRWQKNALPEQQSWKDYKYTIYTIILSGITFISLILIGGFFIIMNYRRR
ncbi:transporter substrate-binding domain-containing protein, partial [Vibrio sp. V30_P3S12P165]|uniref:transporter substrate-binding domain-containing protein n=1 Tax=Vibrio sp. V30_P3S12P165 TaxID=1938682 RepID=UPI00137377C6